MRPTNAEGEAVDRLHSGLATLERGFEGVGGTLRLTAECLHFKAHFLNFQRAPLDVPLADIVSVRPCWGRVLKIPMLRNAMKVSTGSETYRFVVSESDAWCRAIAGAARKTNGAPKTLSAH